MPTDGITSTRFVRPCSIECCTNEIIFALISLTPGVTLMIRHRQSLDKEGHHGALQLTRASDSTPVALGIGRIILVSRNTNFSCQIPSNASCSECSGRPRCDAHNACVPPWLIVCFGSLSTLTADGSFIHLSLSEDLKTSN